MELAIAIYVTVESFCPTCELGLNNQIELGAYGIDSDANDIEERD